MSYEQLKKDSEECGLDGKTMLVVRVETILKLLGEREAFLALLNDNRLHEILGWVDYEGSAQIKLAVSEFDKAMNDTIALAESNQ